MLKILRNMCICRKQRAKTQHPLADFMHTLKMVNRRSLHLLKVSSAETKLALQVHAQEHAQVELLG